MRKNNEVEVELTKEELAMLRAVKTAKKGPGHEPKTVYYVTSYYYIDAVAVEELLGIYDTEEEAKRVASIENQNYKLLDNGKVALVNPVVLNAYDPDPLKFIHFSVDLTKRNTVSERVHIFEQQRHNFGEEIEFRCLESNVHSFDMKGSFVGTIKVVKGKDSEWHKNKIREYAKENMQLVPQWVLDSKDGHK